MIDLRNCDCRDGFATIPDESIDVIFTDPPYIKDLYRDAYAVLATEGARVLKPSGFLATYAGQLHLPEVLRIVEDAGIEYFWIVGQIHTGTASRIWHRNVISSWKPILIFQKPPIAKAPKQLGDIVGGKWRLKRHPWEQSVANTIKVLSRLAGPGATVLDPFCGTGTNLQAASALSVRDAIGFEVDPTTYQLAREKLSQEMLTGRAIGVIST